MEEQLKGLSVVGVLVEVNGDDPVARLGQAVLKFRGQ
jgi:hypothetical protein